MKAKTNNFTILLAGIILVSFGLGLLVFLCSDNINSMAQNDPEKVFIKTKAEVSAPNDSRLDNNEANVTDYILKDPISISNSSSSASSIPQSSIDQALYIAQYNALINMPSTIILTQFQIRELQQYDLSPGDGWKDGKLYINNPVEAAKFMIKFPYLAKYVVSSLVRTGNLHFSEQSPIILFLLLISLTSYLLHKKLKYVK